MRLERRDCPQTAGDLRDHTAVRETLAVLDAIAEDDSDAHALIDELHCSEEFRAMSAREYDAQPAQSSASEVPVARRGRFDAAPRVVAKALTR